MIALIILLALSAVSLWVVCMCKVAGEADRYMEEMESDE